MLRKPDFTNLYRKELPKVGKNPFTYQSDIEKLNMFQIIIRGMSGHDMDPKHYRKYDNFTLHLKICLLTGFICYGLSYIAFHSRMLDAPATQLQMGDTWMDKLIDYTIDFGEQAWDKIKHFFSIKYSI